MSPSAEKNRHYNKAYFKRMTPEQRNQFNKAKYQKYKARYNAQSKQWAKDNREKSQASCHQNTVRKKYQQAFETGDISTTELVDWLVARRGTACKYCGQPSTHIDHVESLAKGGTHTWTNIQMICKDCNYAKRDRSEKEFLDWIKKILDRNGTLFGS